MSPDAISEEPAKQARKAIFGSLSLLVFCGAVFVILFFGLTDPPSGYSGEQALGRLLRGLVLGCNACVLSVAYAITGLIRRERPRWPAITGLALGLLPALGGLYIDCGSLR